VESGHPYPLSVSSAEIERNLLRKPPKCRKEPTTLVHEPYHISPRFYQALEAKALRLENDALKDEVFASTLENPGHLERHNRLIQAQRDQARRLRDFLAASQIRVA
jgi:hypothetical protein